MENYYKCGHDRKHLFLDMEDSFVMVNYFIWRSSKGFLGDKSKCFDCYIKELKEEIKKEKLK